ncbi:hypothetical protein [Cytobacillus solani]|uniref:Uncharacterized protein n=1 Tax=Cytobacillus solani TaxID=1637975 RepID=A0A0Q3U3R5_9BACI|nr:hypothetical protein [Cytobacillus solani]KQL17682.1 hypothetical protein AN957_03020 [Cytobacillus solani]
MSKFKVKGLDKLQKQLKNMESAAKELEKTTSISFDELFITSFMSKNTKFDSFDEFLNAGNFKVESQDDFEAIPEDDMDQHVMKNTNFKDWQTMLETATQEYIQKKLGF